jgi:hypothetical protein
MEFLVETGFNLGLVMRHLFGIGTPRGLQDRPAERTTSRGSLWNETGVVAL